MNSKFKWQRYEYNPVLPAVLATWMESQTSTPDVLEMDKHYFLYLSGRRGGHSRIGVATINKKAFNGKIWNINQKPVIDIGRHGAWEADNVTEPAAVKVNGTVYLYFTAISKKGEKAICVATSSDGIHFETYTQNPVLNAQNPEIVFHENKFYLFHTRPRRVGGFEIHLATSKDGYNFSNYQSRPVLATGRKEKWDGHSVITPRIFKEDNTFYMIYCGSDSLDDYPQDAGLATSNDLFSWARYRQNPIFSRGEEKAWDEGAIKFTTIEKINKIYYLWYSGYGMSILKQAKNGLDLNIGKSQIGLAHLEAEYFFVKP